MEKLYKGQLLVTYKQKRCAWVLKETLKRKDVKYDERDLSKLNRGQACSYIAYLATLVEKSRSIPLKPRAKRVDVRRESERELKKLQKETIKTLIKSRNNNSKGATA